MQLSGLDLSELRVEAEDVGIYLIVFRGGD